MPVHNATVAAIFEEIAELLDVEGANPFRVRAYRNAARSIGALGRDLKTLLNQGEDLTEIPGIGDDLAGKIAEILETGTCRLLGRLRKEVPPAVTELLKIPGLGPVRVKALWHDLDVQTPAQLLRAAKDGRIRKVPGFGPKTEAHILEAVSQHLSHERRFKLAEAAQYAEDVAEYLRNFQGVEDVVIAGSFRRMRETVGDIDILAAAADGARVMERFTRYGKVKEVLSKGSKRGSVVLESGLQVDLRVIPRQSWGAALVYFTGSKAHNIAIRRIAQEKHLKINEYGVYRGQKPVAGADEYSVYRAIGMEWIPPELREDRGEIEAAASGKLPALIELKDLKGDLHAHSKASDGHDSILDMARAAQAAGLEYLAITDHSQRLTVAHGLDPARLARQGAEIARVNAELKGISVLRGIEVDILEDGSLDLPDSVLADLDIVVAAVHSRFNLPRAKQTARIVTALENPLVSILAHPLGRLIDHRDPYDVDMQKVIRCARENRVVLEVNAHPERLDLLDTWCHVAKQEGALVSIDSDAHGTGQIDMLRFGIGQARRGWLEKKDVLNTRTLKQLRAWLKK